MNPQAWGIDPGYHDTSGNWHVPPESTVAALLEAMGAEGPEPPPAPARVMRPEAPLGLDEPAIVRTEDGDEIPVSDRLPEGLPFGYHELVEADGSNTPLIVSPGVCLVPGRSWGWGVQLYTLRSQESWGIGDLGDLARFGKWAAQRGAGCILLNPAHAVDPHPAQPSPYSPSSRCFSNPLYLKIEELPGAAAAGVDLELLAGEGRALNDDRIIRRAEVHRLKSQAFELVFRQWTGDRDFDRYCAERGDLLDKFAAFATLGEHYGPDWREWPLEFRNPDAPALDGWVAANRRRVELHRWLQWCTDKQLRDSARSIDIVHDLAVGVDPTGFDAWMWQSVFVPRVSVGAPPDDFNLGGQGWGVCAFDPWKLRAARYRPFIEMIRAALRSGKGLRYDHVMGLWRLFWIPDGHSPAEGAYVRYPEGDLLDIMALEATRANGFVVGEDLGTVEPGVRDELARRNILSNRLLWFEGGAPSEYPELALAAVTNHDLPTVAGVWTGRDLDIQRSAGVMPNEDFLRAARRKLQEMGGIDPDATVEEAVAAAYGLLSGAPSRVLIATLEDALGVVERPNLPGTIDTYPNWSRALPLPLEAIETHTGVARVTSLLRGGA